MCERRKVARTWWRQLTAYRDEIDEAYDILATLGLAPVCHRLTRELDVREILGEQFRDASDLGAKLFVASGALVVGRA